ncbi:MAG: hypothetical protein M1821_003664 [Bathelium mastoideum]|nr:MAG: hypothetical protein M1821_003664 [Bathelium mastoideum]
MDAIEPINFDDWEQRLTAYQKSTYDLYLGNEFARGIINQHTVSNLEKSARDLTEEEPGPREPVPPAPVGSETRAKVPLHLHQFLRESRPEEDFEPDPQLNVDAIQHVVGVLHTVYPAGSDEKVLVQAAFSELESIKLYAKQLLHNLLKLQSTYNALLDQTVYCETERNKESSMKNAPTATSVKFAKELVRKETVYASFRTTASFVRSFHQRLASKKMQFLFGGLTVLLNILNKGSNGLHAIQLPYPPDFDIREWAVRVEKWSQEHRTALREAIEKQPPLEGRGDTRMLWGWED